MSDDKKHEHSQFWKNLQLSILPWSIYKIIAGELKQVHQVTKAEGRGWFLEEKKRVLETNQRLIKTMTINQGRQMIDS